MFIHLNEFKKGHTCTFISSDNTIILFNRVFGKGYSELRDQPMYNIVPTTPTYLEKLNDTNISQDTSENATIFEMPEKCTKCIEKCGFHCKNSCFANLECNTTNFDYYDDSNYTEIANETCENCVLNYFDDLDQGNLLRKIVGFNLICWFTPPRTPRISGLKSQILKPTFLS